MDHESDSPPSITVQTVVTEASVVLLGRWFEAIVDGLVLASARSVVGDWRIVVGAAQETVVDPAQLRALDERARTAGGGFKWERLKDANNASQYVGALGDEELVLRVDPAAVILASTIIRLMQARSAGVDAVAARHVPLQQQLEAGRAKVSDAAAILRTRAAAVDAPIPVAIDAVVFINSEIEHTGDVVQDAPVSLLEGVLSVDALLEVRNSITRSMSTNMAPTLSIVMRTQAKRTEALREALLCLAGQRDGRFEVLLVVHDADEDGVLSIIADQPSFLSSRTRVVTASGGTRSRPLNVGIAAARGSIVSFLDDDDVVFSNWVGSFLDSARRSPRQLLRAAVGVQTVRAMGWPNGVEGHLIEPGLITPYPAKFDLADNLRLNMTPFMAFAFPRAFFDIFGGADETLEVCEDWDLVLRAAIILGVVEIPALTAVYRRWGSGGDSYSFHPSAVWARDMQRVREKLDAAPLLLGRGSASQLASFSELRLLPAEIAFMRKSTSWRITRPIRWLGKVLGMVGRRGSSGPSR